MISDQERKKAVKFLRERECVKLDCHECYKMSEMVLGNQNALCAIDEQWGALADLIDRPTCTVVSVMFRDEYDEYEVELSCGDSIRWLGSAEDLAFCPSCGAEVVDE